MTTIMGYADRFSVAPGETIEFKVSCEGTDRYEAGIARLVTPQAGPDAPPYHTEPVDCPANGRYPARFQPIHAGSFAAVPAHPQLAGLDGFCLQARIWPTTPDKGRQAIAGCWHEGEGRGFLLEIGEDGRLAARIGDGRSAPLVLALDRRLLARRWYRVAVSLDRESGTLCLSQTPIAENRFDAEPPAQASCGCAVAPAADGLPFLVAAWPAGRAEDAGAWGGWRMGGHYNGKIDAPVLLRGAPADHGIDLAARPLPAELARAVVGAWDFSLDIASETVRDTSANRLHGETVNMPARAMTGHNWTGESMRWTELPAQYGAIHFHDDDIEDCGWQTDFRFEVPAAMKSGVYAAHLRAQEAAFDIVFFVRPPPGTATAKAAFLASTATYTVYQNNRGRFLSPLAALYQGRLTVVDAVDMLLLSHPGLGLSTYDRHSDGSGVCYASRLRPATNVRPTGRHWNFCVDLYIIAWLEHLGVEYDVITDDDLHREGLDLLRPYSVVLTGSHPEYDSREMLDALDGYLRTGGRFMYMGGNGFYWRIAYHPTKPGLIEVRRSEDGVRAWDAEPGESHHSFSGEYGGLWRRQGRAPNRIAGVGFISQGFDACSYYRRMPDADDPRAAFMFEGVAETIIGDFGLLQNGAAGLEIDSADTALGTPPHALVVARSENHSNTYELVAEAVTIPHGATDATLNPDIHADMVFFETPSGGAVWSTGSIAYAGSLPHNGFDNPIARITGNVLRRFLDPEPFALPEG